jgi:hypothetical protein
MWTPCVVSIVLALAAAIRLRPGVPSEADTRSVMTAYNFVDGVPATQNGRLAFRGFIIPTLPATGLLRKFGD